MQPAERTSPKQIEELISHFRNREAKIDAVIYVDGELRPHHILPLDLEASAFISDDVVALKFKPQERDTFFCYGEKNIRSAVSLWLTVQRQIGQRTVPDRRMFGVANLFHQVRGYPYHLAVANHSIRIRITTISLRQLELLEDTILHTGRGGLVRSTLRTLEHSAIHHSYAVARKYANDQRMIDRCLQRSISHPTDVDIGAVQELTWHLPVKGYCELIETMLIPQMEETELDELDL